jgi:hypothetical protein
MPSGKYDADIRAALLGYSKLVPGGAWNDNPDELEGPPVDDVFGAGTDYELDRRMKDALLDKWYDQLRDRSLPPSALPPELSPKEIADLKRRYMRK